MSGVMTAVNAALLLVLLERLVDDAYGDAPLGANISSMGAAGLTADCAGVATHTTWLALCTCFSNDDVTINRMRLATQEWGQHD